MEVVCSKKSKTSKKDLNKENDPKDIYKLDNEQRMRLISNLILDALQAGRVPDCKQSN